MKKIRGTQPDLSARERERLYNACYHNLPAPFKLIFSIPECHFNEFNEIN